MSRFVVRKCLILMLALIIIYNWIYLKNKVFVLV